MNDLPFIFVSDRNSIGLDIHRNRLFPALQLLLRVFVFIQNDRISSNNKVHIQKVFLFFIIILGSAECKKINNQVNLFYFIQFFVLFLFCFDFCCAYYLL